MFGSFKGIFVKTARKEKLPLAVYTQLVDSLYATYASFVAGMICGVIVGVISWMRTGMPIFLWTTIAIVASCAFRTAILFVYRSQPVQRPRLRETARWEAFYALGAWSFMLSLGIIAALGVFEEADLTTLFYGAIVVVGCAGAIAGRNSARPLIVSVQVLLCCGPLALSLLGTGDPYMYGISVMILLFFGSISSTTRQLYAALRKALVQTSINRRLASAYKAERTRFDDALNTMSDGLCMIDSNNKLSVINTCFFDFFPGIDLKIGDGLDDFVAKIGHVVGLSEEALIGFGHKLSESVKGTRTGPIEISTTGNQVFEFQVSRRLEGGAVVLIDDITQRRAAEREIQHMAHFDMLTGLPNRFQFRERIQGLLTSAQRNEERLAVIYVDLDNFKEVNDSLGHPTGDKLLIEVANRLKSVTRGEDLVARFGGDEFVVLQSTPNCQPEQLSSRLIAAVSEPFDIDGHHLVIGASIGIAISPDDGLTADDLIKNADMALYYSKANGRGQHKRFEERMDIDAQKRREIELDLREALAAGAFELHYQPIVDASTRKIASCEALLRWRHPVKGMISPAVFIPVAEETGMIVELGNWVINRACIDAATWPKDVRVAVNLSPIQFRRGTVVEEVSAALVRSGLSPHRLEVEITESLMMSDTTATREAIEALCKIGVRLAIDDFGTGYSSLARINRIPFHKLKIDKSFIDELGQNPQALSIVKAITSLARDLDKSVVAEGVENASQFAALRKLGVEEIQGYLFSRPLPVADLSPLLRKPFPDPSRETLRAA